MNNFQFNLILLISLLGCADLLLARDRNSNIEVVNGLLQYPMLKNEKHYAPLKKNIHVLKGEIENYVELVEHYLMINAGIKNSMVFLSTHENRSLEFFEPGSF